MDGPGSINRVRTLNGRSLGNWHNRAEKMIVQRFNEPFVA
jgi:hypothetical protein